MPTAGSMFSGCLGLDLGLHLAGFQLAWCCESDPACQRVIRARGPDVPLYPDAWGLPDDAPRVDLIAGGFPCQDLSHAGKGVGLTGDRSGLWFAMADAVRTLHPRLVLVENVPGLASKMGGRPGESALGTVIADLAEAGYVGSVVRVRASDVGAPHARERIFILAAAADAGRGGVQRPAVGGGVGGTEGARAREGVQRERRWDAVGDGSPAAADAGRERRDRGGGGDARPTAGGGEDRGAVAARPASTASDASGERLQGRAYGGQRGRAGPRSGDTPPADTGGVGCIGGQVGKGPGDVGFEEAALRDKAGGDLGDGLGSEVDWGAYEPAVRRWERILGRAAPRPTDDRGRLSPRFVEWMLGFPDGWVDVPGVRRTAQLRMLGNSVQVQVAEQAGRSLLEEHG